MLKRREAGRRGEHPTTEQKLDRLAALFLTDFQKGGAFRWFLGRLFVTRLGSNLERSKADRHAELGAKLGYPRGYLIEPL